MATFETHVVKAVRAELKRVFPKFRFQVSKGYTPAPGWSSYSIDITVVRSAIDFAGERMADGDSHSVASYTSNPEFFNAVISTVQTAANINPEWPVDYIYVSIGAPGKPYVIK